MKLISLNYFIAFFFFLLLFLFVKKLLNLQKLSNVTHNQERKSLNRKRPRNNRHGICRQVLKIIIINIINLFKDIKGKST